MPPPRRIRPPSSEKSMAWNEPGGDKDRDPWRSGHNDKGPPDLDEIVRNLQDKFGGLFGKGGRRPSRGNGSDDGGGSGSGGGGSQLPRRFAGFGINFLLTIAVAAWVLSGIYIIDEG